MYDQIKQESPKQAFEPKNPIFISHKQKNKSKSQILAKNQIPSPNEGKWKVDEQIIYFNFLEQNSEVFNSRSVLKNDQVFKEISKSLEFKRTPEQCKSHYYKMLRNISYSPSSSDLIQYLRHRLKNKVIRGQKLRNFDQKLNENKKVFEQEGCQMWVQEGRTLTVTISVQMSKVRKWF